MGPRAPRTAARHGQVARAFDPRPRNRPGNKRSCPSRRSIPSETRVSERRLPPIRTDREEPISRQLCSCAINMSCPPPLRRSPGDSNSPQPTALRRTKAHRSTPTAKYAQHARHCPPTCTEACPVNSPTLLRWTERGLRFVPTGGTSEPTSPKRTRPRRPASVRSASRPARKRNNSSRQHPHWSRTWPSRPTPHATRYEHPTPQRADRRHLAPRLIPQPSPGPPGFPDAPLGLKACATSPVPTARVSRSCTCRSPAWRRRFRVLPTTVTHPAGAGAGGEAPAPRGPSPRKNKEGDPPAFSAGMGRLSSSCAILGLNQ